MVKNAYFWFSSWNKNFELKGKDHKPGWAKLKILQLKLWLKPAWLGLFKGSDILRHNLTYLQLDYLHWVFCSSPSSQAYSRIFVCGLFVSNPIFNSIDLIDNLTLDSKYSSFTAYPVMILNTSISHHFQFHLILGVNPNRSDFKNSISSICTNCYFNFSISLTWALSSHKLLLVRSFA